MTDSPRYTGRTHQASGASDPPHGFRYVIKGRVHEGQAGYLDAFDVVMKEFGDLPIHTA